MTDSSLLETIIACPECLHSPLERAGDLNPLPQPFASVDGYRCSACAREFPRVDGVAVLWSDQLRDLHLSGDGPDELEADEQVLGANIRIYDKIADNYDEHSDKIFSYHQTLLFLKALGVDATSGERQGPQVCVDVGCGPGVSLEAGSSFFDCSVGVDISLANLRLVADKGFAAVLADSSSLPFRPETIDLATCFAALHHFPSPEDFMAESRRCLKEGGVLVTGADPSANLLSMGPLASAVWDARKPVYRFLGRFTDRYYLHSDAELQRINDMAENHRTAGGFSHEALEAMLDGAGFDAPQVFYGLDPDGLNKMTLPDRKVLLLKVLSFQNPARPRNWMSLSTVSRK